MRHTKVAETPCEDRGDGQQTVRLCFTGLRTVRAEHGQVARHGLCILDDDIHAAGGMDTVDDDGYQRNRHDDALDQVGGACRHKAAHCTVQDDNDCACDHRNRVVDAEHRVEQLAAGSKAGCGVRDEENDDDNGCDARQNALLVAVAVGEEGRQGDRVCRMGVQTDLARDEKPVEVGADRKTDCGPARITDTGQVRKTRQTHQQPGTHIGGLRTHRNDKRTELSAAEIEIIGSLVAVGEVPSDTQHQDEIRQDCHNDTHLGRHITISFNNLFTNTRVIVHCFGLNGNMN